MLSFPAKLSNILSFVSLGRSQFGYSATGVAFGFFV